ncbi:DUF4157 domain-containing protein [Streptomyces sp. ISL-11]|uniref:eCIS core domain-containing protein n=1 Tax=Streptomyces sp. ISL-11 TaxID=2819174 RepID=UPI001BEC8C52|nr:DUF4157 domain-containing protein [Streptomyces sp. ISL-11]MBT2382267.1 DUF4157 domain-containing protein [Streptomyces sp. ISL-11]
MPEHGLPQPARDLVRRPGAPLPPELRADAEQRFRHDFGHVRLHTDPHAARAASTLRARAFTVGPHIAFAAGRFAPATPAGARLLTHELAHVVQQDLGVGAHTHGTSAEAEAASLAGDPHAPRAVRVAAPVGVHRSGESRQFLEGDTHAHYYPAAYRPQVLQPGVDLVLGGNQPEYTQNTDPTGRVQVLERVTGGTWIQIKRLDPSTDMSALKKNVANGVNVGVGKFQNALAHPEKAANQPMAGAKWESGKPQGTWNRTILQNPKRLFVHIEVPGFSGMTPSQQAELQHTARTAASGNRFGRISFGVLVVDTPPPARGAALGRMRFTQTMARELGGSLKVLTTLTILAKLFKAVQFIEGAYKTYQDTVERFHQAERAAKNQPFILTEETNHAISVRTYMADGRAEQERYSQVIESLPPLLFGVGGSGDLGEIAKTAFSLLSASSSLASLQTSLDNDITVLEGTLRRAEQRKDAAAMMLRISPLVKALNPSTLLEVDAFMTHVDLEHVINNTYHAIEDAKATRDRIIDDTAFLDGWIALLREWHTHLEAKAAQPAGSAGPPSTTLPPAQ